MSLNPETCLQEEGCKDRAYKKVTLEECTETQTHLSAEERQAFKEDSETDTDGFDGRLGCYSQTKINIRLKPNAKPVHTKQYPVPYNREKTFKRESKHLVREIIIPKKDDRVRWVSNF